MIRIIIALAVLALTGCATEVVPPSKAISAPSDRVFKYQQVFPDQATLVVVRDSGYIGGGCYATVFINGDRVAKLDPKEKHHSIFLPEPGQLELHGKVLLYALRQ